jgi:superfamily I DNA/RNA helicase
MTTLHVADITRIARAAANRVSSTLEVLGTKTSKAKTGATAGPYPVEWESDDAEVQRSVLGVLQLPAGAAVCVGCGDLAAHAHKNGLLQLRDWAQHQIFVRGLATVTVADVVSEVGQIVRRERAFGPNRPWQRRVMTIHQAKNREFESVIVRWPLKLGGQAEQKRRLLYNAVTRARGRAVVIVQDPKGKVVTGPLFMGEA